MPYGGSVQVSPKLRKGAWNLYTLYVHYCPACKEMHQYRVRAATQPQDPNVPSWSFDGDLELPTFAPSMRISDCRQTNQGPVWTTICHYTMTKGIIEFHSDCPHDMKGQKVPLPDLPEEYRD